MSVEDRVLRLENAFATLVEIQRGLEERFDTHEKWINELGAVQVELGAVQVELGAAQAELTKAQARTEASLAETNERLNSLINVFERHLNEGRNGVS
ncbi:MAG TPA: hypothetical protein VF766_06350 [Pyrinomonadaceae bacterium]